MLLYDGDSDWDGYDDNYGDDDVHVLRFIILPACISFIKSFHELYNRAILLVLTYRMLYRR